MSTVEVIVPAGSDTDFLRGMAGLQTAQMGLMVRAVWPPKAEMVRVLIRPRPP